MQLTKKTYKRKKLECEGQQNSNIHKNEYKIKTLSS